MAVFSDRQAQHLPIAVDVWHATSRQSDTLSFFGLTLVYTRTRARKMDNSIGNKDDRFANGQVSRYLRGNSDATESETQLDPVDVIDQCSDVAPEEFPAP